MTLFLCFSLTYTNLTMNLPITPQTLKTLLKEKAGQRTRWSEGGREGKKKRERVTSHSPKKRRESHTITSDQRRRRWLSTNIVSLFLHRASRVLNVCGCYTICPFLPRSLFFSLSLSMKEKKKANFLILEKGIKTKKRLSDVEREAKRKGW